ncbi:hypothetical protein Tco_0024965 [Tanacetum coccineum]
MYLTASRPDIMFAVCACSRFQVTPKTSHLQAVKRIFMYLKGQQKLGLWYPRESSFDLEAYSNSDYPGANFDRKFTTGGCQFFGRRLISWQCKKQTIVATSATKAEYVAAANCYGQLRAPNSTYKLVLPVLGNMGWQKVSTARQTCAKHNMVAYMEKTEGNAEFHEIVDFLTRSYIHYALTVSLVVSTSFVEQFWNSATSKTVNNVSQIHVKVAGKPVTISKALIRRDLLFNDADGIDCLTNQDIFDNLSLMGYEGDLSNVTSLFPSMLAQAEEDEDEISATPAESQPTPSPVHPNLGDQVSAHSLSLHSEGLGGSSGEQVLDLQTHMETQAAEILKLKSRIKKLKKKCKYVLSHHKTWLKSVSIKKRLGKKDSIKKKLKKKEYVSKQGRKNAKTTPTVEDSTAFDDLDADLDEVMDYTKKEDALNEGRTSSKTEELNLTIEDKGSGGSTEEIVSIAKLDERTAKPKDSNAKPEVSTADIPAEDTDVFGDEDTIADVLVMMKHDKAKVKGVEIKEVENTERPATLTRSVLTLKSLLTIDPKDKGKGVLQEEPEPIKVKSKGQDEAQIAFDAEVARQLSEKFQEELEKERIAQ